MNHINLRLGFLILAIAFALIAWLCWIWEGKSPRRKVLRALTICFLAVGYFSLVGVQIREQNMKDHATPTGEQTQTPPLVINQNATDSPCANPNAQSGSTINCNVENGNHDK